MNNTKQQLIPLRGLSPPKKRIHRHLRISQIFIILISSIFIQAKSYANEKKHLKIFTAAGISSIIESAAKNFQIKNNIQVKINSASSPILARQIIHGAEADIFISAHPIWTEELKKKGIVNEDNIIPFASTKLALFKLREKNSNPHNPDEPIRFSKNSPTPLPPTAKIAISDQNVPSGIYARQAIKWLGWDEKVKNNLVSFPDVKAVISSVQSKNLDAGISYLADINNYQNMEIIGIFPQESHEKIIFSIVRISQNQATNDFITYLLSDAKEIFIKNGFEILLGEQGNKF